jgi:hypothetical protein
MTNDEQIFERLGGIDTKLDTIYEQTKKTNGRVTKLEEWREKMDINDAYGKGLSKGKIIIITAIFTAGAFVVGQIIIPLISAWIQK